MYFDKGLCDSDPCVTTIVGVVRLHNFISFRKRGVRQYPHVGITNFKLAKFRGTNGSVPILGPVVGNAVLCGPTLGWVL